MEKVSVCWPLSLALSSTARPIHIVMDHAKLKLITPKRPALMKGDADRVVAGRPSREPPLPLCRRGYKMHAEPGAWPLWTLRVRKLPPPAGSLPNSLSTGQTRWELARSFGQRAVVVVARVPAVHDDRREWPTNGRLGTVNFSRVPAARGCLLATWAAVNLTAAPSSGGRREIGACGARRVAPAEHGLGMRTRSNCKAPGRLGALHLWRPKALATGP